MESRTSALVAMMVEPIRIDCLVTLSETLTPIAVRASAVQSPVGMMLQPATKKHGIAEAVQQYTRLVRTTTDVIENWGIGEERSTSVDKTIAQPRYRTRARCSRRGCLREPRRAPLLDNVRAGPHTCEAGGMSGRRSHPSDNRAAGRSYARSALMSMSNSPRQL